MRLEKCPVCGAKIELDDGYGVMEIWDRCDVDNMHYSFFMNVFVTSARVLNDKYDLETKEGVKAWKERREAEGWE